MTADVKGARHRTNASTPPAGRPAFCASVRLYCALIASSYVAQPSCDRRGMLIAMPSSSSSSYVVRRRFRRQHTAVTWTDRFIGAARNLSWWGTPEPHLASPLFPSLSLPTHFLLRIHEFGDLGSTVSSLSRVRGSDQAANAFLHVLGSQNASRGQHFSR